MYSKVSGVERRGGKRERRGEGGGGGGGGSKVGFQISPLLPCTFPYHPWSNDYRVSEMFPLKIFISTNVNENITQQK